MKNRKDKIFTTRLLTTLLIIVLAILFYILLDNFAAVRSWVGQFVSVLSPFITGAILAYLLNMPMGFFERTIFANVKGKRILSILFSYILAAIVLGLLLWSVIPQLVKSISTVISSVSFYLSDLDNTFAEIAAFFGVEVSRFDFIRLQLEEVINALISSIQSLLPQLANYIFSLGTGVINTITAIIASIYLLFGKEKLLRQCKKIIYALFPRKAGNEIMRVAKLSNTVFSGFISGKLLDSAIIGIICFFFMQILVMLDFISAPIATLIAVIIGVTNIIPFFGPFIGAIPSAVILLTINPLSCVIFVIFVIVLQQFDGNVLGPKILGNTTGLPPFLVLFSIVVGGGLFNIPGMLIGVPAAAVLYNVVGDIMNRRLKNRHIDVDDLETSFEEAEVEKAELNEDILNKETEKEKEPPSIKKDDSLDSDESE